MQNVIKVYHAGFLRIKEPDIHYGRKNADFGQGFYVTPNQEFANRWAKVRKGEESIVNTYELDLSGLNIRRFTRDEDWFRYIFSNRRSANDYLDADVIMGPIANDTIFDTMGIITSGFLEDQDALKLLMPGPEYMQIAIKSERAAEQLNWTGSRVLTEDEIADYEAMVAKEQEDYLEELVEVMEHLSEEK